MEGILIGKNANGQDVYITPEMRRSTHMHVIGGSGTGKSKFFEWLIRRDIREGNGLCLIDWHGTLYNDVVRYCAHLDVGLYNDFRSVILINPSQPDFVTGFNPFMNQGADVSTQVSNRIAATIRPWGITDTNQMPTFERVCRLIYTFAVEHGQTLPNVAQLLQFNHPELREYAMRMVSDSYIKEQWQQLALMTNFRDWSNFVLSAENRLGRFLSSKTIKRFMGLCTGNLDLMDIMNRQKILLVNLGSSGYLDRESARVFASLFLNEFFETTMRRAQMTPHGQKPTTFTLYLDEFQEYITDDIAAMLDQVRKGGLHLALAHQHLGHLADNQRLLESVLVNARIRAVFGGLSYKDACELGNEMFLPDLNTRQIKKAYYHTTHLYREETRMSKSHTTGQASSKSFSTSLGKGTSEGYSSGEGKGSSSGYSSGAGMGTGSHSGFSYAGNLVLPAVDEGWFSDSKNVSQSEFSSDSSVDTKFVFEGQSKSTSNFFGTAEAAGTGHSVSHGETIVPVWVPIPVQELGSETEWTREEKLSKVAELLKCQQQQHCFIKLDTQITQPIKIPFVRDYFLSQNDLLGYEQAIYEAQGALPGHIVDKLLEEGQQQFLVQAQRPIVNVSISEEDSYEKKVDKKSKATSNKKSKDPNIFDSIVFDEFL